MCTACPFCLMDKYISTKKGLKIGEFCIQAALVILGLIVLADLTNRKLQNHVKLQITRENWITAVLCKRNFDFNISGFGIPASRFIKNVSPSNSKGNLYVFVFIPI
jgi:hypothetical protein